VNAAIWFSSLMEHISKYTQCAIAPWILSALAECAPSVSVYVVAVFGASGYQTEMVLIRATNLNIYYLSIGRHRLADGEARHYV